MKKSALWILLLGVAAFSFAAGVFLQRNHALAPLRRLVQGRTVHVQMPETTILDIDFAKVQNSKPKFELKDLSFEKIQKNRALYQYQLRELLRLPEFPGSYEPILTSLEKTDLGKVIREKIAVETEPGVSIPFYLFIPKSSGPHPFILVVHGHSAGKIETAGIVPPVEANANAQKIAEEGFVTVAPDLRGFGELGWPGDWTDQEGFMLSRSIHIQDVLYNLEAGRTVLGSYLFDLEQILKALSVRPEIDFNRMGVAGTSMGGDIAIWLGILNDQVKVVVSSHGSLLGKPRRPKDYGSYHACADTIPGIDKFFRLNEIPFLLAGRPFLLDFNAGPGAKSLETAQHLKSLYAANAQGEEFSFETHRGGEAFYHEKAVRWFRKWL